MTLRVLASPSTTALAAAISTVIASAVAAAEPCAVVDHREDVLIVRGTLAGKSIRVLVDTGASTASLSPRLAKLQKPLPNRRVAVAGATGKQKQSDVYSVLELRIGEVELVAFDAHVSADGAPYDIAIGTDQLAPFVVDVDLRTNRFCLGREKPKADWQPFATEPEPRIGSTVLVPVQIGRRRFERFIFDTGAGMSSIAAHRLGNLPIRKRPSIVSVDVTGARARQRVIAVDDLCVLGQCARTAELMLDADMSKLNGFQTDGILGVPFMKGRRVLLDLAGKQLAIE